MKPCQWCRAALVDERRAVFCGRKCRQAAFRQRRSTRAAGFTADEVVHQRREATGSVEPGRFVYADPPYPGMAHYYDDQPTYAGEVDHAKLIASLVDGRHTGWALSTSSKTLREVLPLCPSHVRVCAWVKPIGVSGETRGLHSTWEPLIICDGRKLRPGIRDWVEAMPARLGGSDLIGRKPQEFCAFLFDALGMLPGDELVDLFPGSGIVSRAWAELSQRADAQLSLLSLGAGARRQPLLSLLQRDDGESLPPSSAAEGDGAGQGSTTRGVVVE